ncbi:unnamed protein product [Tenebrio molitor]|nr:unnamed protein product [Tenebrio molitor]
MDVNSSRFIINILCRLRGTFCLEKQESVIIRRPHQSPQCK